MHFLVYWLKQHPAKTSGTYSVRLDLFQFSGDLLVPGEINNVQKEHIISSPYWDSLKTTSWVISCSSTLFTHTTWYLHHHSHPRLIRTLSHISTSSLNSSFRSVTGARRFLRSRKGSIWIMAMVACQSFILSLTLRKMIPNMIQMISNLILMILNKLIGGKVPERKGLTRASISTASISWYR